MKENITDFLLNNADFSIILRIKRELLNCIYDKEDDELLNKIIPQKIVQKILQSQKPDGWFGNAFHGQSPSLGAGMYDNMEVGLRYLAEKGFSPENEYISKAINSFLLKEPFDSAYKIKPPIPPATDYTYTACGLYLARSSLIIRAGYEYRLPENSFINLKHDIDYSFKSFLNILNYSDVDDLINTHKKKLCFKPGVLYPCMYDLRMLAHSQGWRNKKNISLLADSLNQLFSFPQYDEMVYTYKKGQYVGPAFAFIHSQMKNLGFMEEEITETTWFDMMELFARCGIVKQVELLKDKYESLPTFIDENLNLNININKHSGHGWSPYFGIALEEDWKTNIRVKCDLLFRILLIIHHTERNE
jgi:hypothetical protein